MRQNIRMNWRIALSAFLALVCAGIVSALDVPAANGSNVPVVGIRNATAAGLELQLKEGDEVRVIPWRQLDMAKIRQQLPEVFAAYEKAAQGQNTPVNLGSFAPKTPAPGANPGGNPNMGRDGALMGTIAVAHVQALRAGENFSGGEAMLAIPNGVGSPKAVMVVTWRDPANGADFANPRSSRLLPFAQENQLAILGVTLQHKGDEPTYQNVEGGSGQAVLDALTALAGKFNKPQLAEAPLIMLGSPRSSGGFAFNFAQWKPERVAVVVTGHGENYVAEPSPEGIKIPTLFFTIPSGAVFADDEPEFGLEKTWLKFRDRNPPWVYAKFPYDLSGADDADFFFAQRFIDLVLRRRLQGGEMTEFNPNAGAQMGNRETFELVAANPENEKDPNFTWLPDLNFANAWVKYSEGETEDVE